MTPKPTRSPRNTYRWGLISVTGWIYPEQFPRKSSARDKLIGWKRYGTANLWRIAKVEVKEVTK